RADPDNAQSWYRHQLAETGIVGSLGWIAWVASIALLLWRARPRAGCEAEMRILRSALIAIGLVSAVSMPTQHPADAFTVIVFVPWLAFLVEPSIVARQASERIAPRVVGVSLWTLALLYAAVTLYVGKTHFRPPMRALRFDWHYAYGWYPPEMVDGRLS